MSESKPVEAKKDEYVEFVDPSEKFVDQI